MKADIGADMNIRQAAQGLQLMDDYLDEASAATVLGDVRVILKELDLLREVAHKLREQLAAATDANISLLLDEDRLQAENERLRHALKFITTTRPDGAPAYGEALMFDVAADALEATMQAHYPAGRP
jgi:hypothetical protein